MFSEEEIADDRGQDAVFYTFADSYEAAVEVQNVFSEAGEQNLIIFTSALDGSSAFKKLSSFKTAEKLSALVKACPELVLRNAKEAVWIELETARRLDFRKIKDLKRRALCKKLVMLESTEKTLHKSFRLKDMLKNFSVKLLWSKMKKEMKSLDSSVIIRDLGSNSLLGHRIISLLTRETLSKEGFDLALDKAVNDCKLENVNVCNADDFFNVYLRRK